MPQRFLKHGANLPFLLKTGPQTDWQHGEQIMRHDNWQNGMKNGGKKWGGKGVFLIEEVSIKKWEEASAATVEDGDFLQAECCNISFRSRFVVSGFFHFVRNICSLIFDLFHLIETLKQVLSDGKN